MAHLLSFSDIRSLVYKKISRLAPHLLIRDDTSLENDLGLDSLDTTALLIEIEEELGADLNSVTLKPILNVNDIITSFYRATE